MLVQSYLFFNGRCEEALEFYRKALGAQVTMMMRFKDNPAPMTDGCGPDGGPAPDPNSVMHASFKIGETEVMASEGMGGGKAEFKGFSLSVSVASDAEAQRLFKLLGEGGKVEMPMDKTFFASSFGMVADRFGVSWMVINPLPMP
jgi:PhnB protein